MLYSDYGITCNSNITTKNLAILLNDSIERAAEKERYDMWITMLPHIQDNKASTFEKFKTECLLMPTNSSKITADAIRHEMRQVVAQDKKNKGATNGTI